MTGFSAFWGRFPSTLGIGQAKDTCFVLTGVLGSLHRVTFLVLSQTLSVAPGLPHSSGLGRALTSFMQMYRDLDPLGFLGQALSPSCSPLVSVKSVGAPVGDCRGLSPNWSPLRLISPWSRAFGAFCPRACWFLSGTLVLSGLGGFLLAVAVSGAVSALPDDPQSLPLLE